jgi:aspartate-semialdehyde dehydrogenase
MSVVTPIPVAVLGATGTVGQKLVRVLEHHPWFRVVTVTASDGNVGRRYDEAVRWREPTPIPAAAGELRLAPTRAPIEAPLVFSALDTETAAEVEPLWARAGSLVVTNASPFRLAPDVPLVIPEVNPDHLGLLAIQRERRGWSGGIVANPNCTTTGLVLALTPLHHRFGIRKLFVATMQAVSGAGWPGVASLDIQGNVIPYIPHEEDKVERETRKLLGTLGDGRVHEAPIALSVHTNRVPVVDGHTECLSVEFGETPSLEQVRWTLSEWRPTEQIASLPSTPAEPLWVEDRSDRPQPRLDLDRGNGMTVTVGRIRACPVLDIRLVLLSHNTVRGAAGATVQNAELLVSEGLVR